MSINRRMDKSNMLYSYNVISGKQCSTNIFMFLVSLVLLSKGNWHIRESLLLDSFVPHIARTLDLEPYVPIQRTINLISPRAKCLQSRVRDFPLCLPERIHLLSKAMVYIGKTGFFSFSQKNRVVAKQCVAWINFQIPNLGLSLLQCMHRMHLTLIMSPWKRELRQ